MKHILVVNLQDSFVYNIVETVRQCCDFEVRVVGVGELEGCRVGQDCCGVVLSPGGGVPSEYPALMEFIDRWHTTVPMLGVCLGHQALCQYFGAKLYCLAAPLHGHAEMLRITQQSPVFAGVAEPIAVGLYHSWAVDTGGVEALETLATDSRGVVMAVRHTKLPIYGFQFHPESYISGEKGRRLLQNWLQNTL